MTDDKLYYRVYSEWDIGLEDTIFEDMIDAESTVREHLVSSGIEDSLEELKGEGLVSFEPVELRKEIQ